MAVPAHDERDWEFARKYALPIRAVVSETATLGLAGGSPCEAEPLECFTGEGFSIHSGPLDGFPTRLAKAEIIARLEALGVGKKTVTYKLRDWLFSRQRYWGEPFPIVWENGHHRPLDASELPLTPPPLDDFKPTGTGEPPLAKATEWVRYRAQPGGLSDISPGCQPGVSGAPSGSTPAGVPESFRRPCRGGGRWTCGTPGFTRG